MSNLAYKILNPVVKIILRSPLHALMSANTIILQYTGIKSGRTFTLPVSYARAGNEVFCFTARSNRWWRNLVGGKTVRLTLAGRNVNGVTEVEAENETVIAETLGMFLRATPRDAGPSQVRLDEDGTPHPADVKEAAKRLVRIKIVLAA